MKRRRKFGGTSLLAVPLRSAGLGGWRRQTQLRSTASKEGRGSRGADLTTGVGLENEELLTKNRSQRVTPLLAQRITLTGNSYFWRTAAGGASHFLSTLGFSFARPKRIGSATVPVAAVGVSPTAPHCSEFFRPEAEK